MSSSANMTTDRSSSSTPNRGLSGASEDVGITPRKQSSRKLQPNLTRRSHKKSRAGCFSCKTRKIKCSESRPICEQCAFKKTTCVYPSCADSRKDPGKDQAVTRKSSSLSPTISFTTDTFSLQDLQFFHQFLTIAYPHLPLGNDAVWVKDIPQFAQDHCFLMHAMLALGASHLGRVSPRGEPYDSAALVHRGKAIAGLNRVLPKTELAYGEADAMLATCYALTFQSTYMADGMADFVTFVRGCALATVKIRDVEAETAFDIRPNRHFDIVRPRLKRLPSINPLHVYSALEALEALQTFLTNQVECSFFNAIHGLFTAMQKSTLDGYLGFVTIFDVWCSLDSEEFKRLIDPDNTMAQILLAYFVATELLMIPLTVHEWPRRASHAPARSLMGIISWSYEIVKKIPTLLQHHLQWPKSIVATVVAELSGLPFKGPAVLLMDKRELLLTEQDEYLSELQQPGDLSL